MNQSFTTTKSAILKVSHKRHANERLYLNTTSLPRNLTLDEYTYTHCIMALLNNVPTHKTDRLQRLQNQCARILTKSPRREHITPVLKSLHWLKIQDRITSHIKY